MVLKFSEIVLFDVVILMEIIDEVGLFYGVFNLVNGDGLGVGCVLFVYFDVDMVFFIGSIWVGIEIVKNVANMVKWII